MRFIVYFHHLFRVALLVCAATAPLYLSAQDQPASQDKPTPGPALLPAQDKARINALAHKLLAAALNVDSLGGKDLQPWHIRIGFSMLPVPTYDAPSTSSGGRRRGGGAAPQTDAPIPKSATGTAEEWHTAHYQWSRTYKSLQPSWSGSEWRLSRLERDVAAPKHEQFDREMLQKRVMQPVIDPLWQLAALLPDAQLTLNRITTDGKTINCVAPASSIHAQNPEWELPTLCFDTDLRLQLVSSSTRVIQYEDFQPFQGRAVARTVRVLINGHVDSEMKITQLESFDSASNADVMKPPATAVLQPYTLEPGDPAPESVYETGVVIPLTVTQTPFRGPIPVQVLLRRNGSIKVLSVQGGFGMAPIQDAVSNAVSRWKYKPYLVDGQPVEVAFSVVYTVDGKRFVPSYERTDRAQGSNTP